MSSDIEGRLERLRKEVEELKAKGEVVVSEKLANPAPLGLAGFGITTLLLNVVNAEIISKDSIGMVLAGGPLLRWSRPVPGRHVGGEEEQHLRLHRLQLLRRLLDGVRRDEDTGDERRDGAGSP